MKNNLILIIVSGLIFMGMIFGLSDYARIRNSNTPMFMFLLKQDDNQNFYYGLGYKFIRTSNSNFDSINTDIKDEFGLWFYSKEIEIKKPEYVYAINIEENNNENFTFYFEDSLGFEYYTAGIKDIEINDGNVKTLENVIKDSVLSMDEILNNFQLKTVYSSNKYLYEINDGGANKKIKVLKDLENNKYYIGLEETDFEKIIYEKIISKEYTVLNLEKAKTNDYIFITLKDNYLDEVDTIKLSNNKAFSLIEKNNYRFSFVEQNTNDGTINSIFENSKLKDIILIQN